MNWHDWAAQLIGTLIGTGVGFGLAMWWDRKKERDRESRDRSDTIESVLLELRGILDQLGIADAEGSPIEARQGAIAIEFSIPFLSHSAFDAAVHSGKLTLLRPELQGELSTIYEQVRLMRLHVDRATTSYAHGSGVGDHRAIVENATQYLRGQGQMLNAQLQAVCQHLEAARVVPEGGLTPRSSGAPTAGHQGPA